MSSVVSLNYNVDIAALIREVRLSCSSEGASNRYFDNGHGRFISIMNNGLLVAASFHDSKWHSATARVELFGRDFHNQKSEAPPGKWAVAWCSQAACGKRTYYDTW